jgi:hypothetical protein
MIGLPLVAQGGFTGDNAGRSLLRYLRSKNPDFDVCPVFQYRRAEEVAVFVTNTGDVVEDVVAGGSVIAWSFRLAQERSGIAKSRRTGIGPLER